MRRAVVVLTCLLLCIAIRSSHAQIAPGLETRAGRVAPAIARGQAFFGFPERFNRYYTEPAWRPTWIIHVSPTGGGSGATRDQPTTVQAAVAAAEPGTIINFTRGTYDGCFEFTPANSGTYDNPVVLYGERNANGSIGVTMRCCGSGRQSCFNLENARYVAFDGFELVGGKYGVRVVGAGYKASEHALGIAVLNCVGHEQSHDPFFSGATDWAVWERNRAYGAKAGDGHGIYLSNGSDWNIVRHNETYANDSSDFQINADPASTCKDEGIAYDDPRCDAFAGTGEGGQGASDYFLIESNHFHSGLGPGPNFTSVRRSVVRNNIFGPQARHNVSFWQETDNPRLGSSDNRIVNNLFITTGRHAVQFANHSNRNLFANNILLGVRREGAAMVANPAATLMTVDGTVGDNIYRFNLYAAGRIEGRAANAEEIVRADFSAAWFERFPVGITHDPNALRPTAGAPFLKAGIVFPEAPLDRNGVVRAGRVDLGPIEARR